MDRYGKQGWTPADARWQGTFKIDLADPAIAPDKTIKTFQYRAYLKSRGLSKTSHTASNPLAGEWHAFRDARDDRAWKWLTDAIRAYAATKGRRVLINANGLARYVDLQVLGVWENWRTKDGRIDLSESQLDQWGSTVAGGWGVVGRKVPVVLFHDWGFGGFPWMEISPEDRRLWIRVRGAEIYAAGGFFAFPVHGPMGNDARNLHQHLRNPPTFVVNMPKGGSFKVHIRGVTTHGAKLQWQVDGRVEKMIDLPDRDGKNDAMAPEYDQTFELPIPPGRHRLSLDNVGGDWASRMRCGTFDAGD